MQKKIAVVSVLKIVTALQKMGCLLNVSQLNLQQKWNAHRCRRI